ncbi:MAG: hypothetical protein KatS3mg009_0896 [Acidimicrobiia bacterium]|nr:MAG: hypothetical protein KatS3mg009_0896 [Acidimicrobiia bacterium]
MDLLRLEAALEALTVAEIRSVAQDLAAARTTPADEIEAMRATLEVEHALRRTRRQTQAAAAAHSVTLAVQAAARRERLPLPDDAVTRVARAAAQVARAIVAGEGCEADVRCLARGLQRVVDLAGAVAAR